jgi:hypothetical protein
MNRRDVSFNWQPVPICFACGKELGTGVNDVLYMGWGERQGGRGPAWVTTLCPCEHCGGGEGRPHSCVEVAQEFAARDGREISAEEYLEWLKSA